MYTYIYICVANADRIPAGSDAAGFRLGVSLACSVHDMNSSTQNVVRQVRSYRCMPHLIENIRVYIYIYILIDMSPFDQKSVRLDSLAEGVLFSCGVASVVIFYFNQARLFLTNNLPSLFEKWRVHI